MGESNIFNSKYNQNQNQSHFYLNGLDGSSPQHHMHQQNANILTHINPLNLSTANAHNEVGPVNGSHIFTDQMMVVDHNNDESWNQIGRRDPGRDHHMQQSIVQINEDSYFNFDMKI